MVGPLHKILTQEDFCKFALKFIVMKSNDTELTCVVNLHLH